MAENADKGKSLGRIAVIGSGSWATALAKLLLDNNERILWLMRSEKRVESFRRNRHNIYLTDLDFDVSRIDFSCNINNVATEADTLLLAVPSPYLQSTLDDIVTDISHKTVISAVKGIVPDENKIITGYMASRFGCKEKNLAVIGGPCHAEEVALGRMSYLTIGCSDMHKARIVADSLSGSKLKTVLSQDVEGIEYAAVLKNIYAIAGGIIHGMNAGDNFMAVMVSNAIREIRSFLEEVAPMAERDICQSAYLGDLLVTAYSRFSRNHNFGAMIGKGYSVKAAIMEMEMVAEGYYAASCIHNINREAGVKMPIAEAVYEILYLHQSPRKVIKAVMPELT